MSPSSGDTAPVAWLRRVYGASGPHVVGLLVSILAGLAVVLTAINTQSGRILDGDGHAWPFRALFGPGWVRNLQGWAVVVGDLGEGASLFRRLLGLFLVVDSAFAILLGVLLLLLVAALGTAGRWYRVSQIAVGVLVLLDLIENLVAAIAVFGGGPTSVVAALSVAKWAVAVGVAALVVLRLVVPLAPDERGVSPRESARARLARATRAVMHQRFSYLPVVTIFLLSVPSGAALLEQLPDVQRRWLTDGSAGVRHGIVAILSTVLLGVFLIMVGKHRTRYALEHPAPVDDHGRQPGLPSPPPEAAAPPSGSKPGLAPGPATAVVPRARPEPAARPGPESGGGRPPAAVDPAGRGAGQARPSVDGGGERESARDLLLRFGVWGFGFAVIVGGFLVVLVFGPRELLLWRRTLVALAVPVAIVGASLVIRHLWTARPGRPPVLQPRPDRPVRFTPAEAQAVETAGYVAGLAMIAVGALSLWRSLTPLVILPQDAYASAAAPVAPGAIAGLLVVGTLGLLAPWAYAIVALASGAGLPRLGARREAAPDDSTVDRARAALDRHGAWGLLGVAVLVYLALGFAPALAAWLGLSATAILALGALAGIVSAAGLVIQDQPTAEVFRLVRLRRTPLVSLLVVTIALVGALGGSGSIHAVDRGPDLPTATTGGRPDPRPSLDRAFADWLADDGCTVVVDGRPVRPMVMIAAEGGGIRAAYWTVRGVEALAGICPDQPALFSGGASGGSVGLTVAGLGGADPSAAVRAVTTMAAPPPLTRTADGTFVRDLLYGTTGIPVPRVTETDAWDWRDRARLLEDGWRESGPWASASFLGTPPSSLTGSLVLNSTSVRDTCRVWVSQLRIPGPPADRAPTFDPELTCDKAPTGAPRTVDLFRSYGPYGDEIAAPTCLGDVAAVTAALLTARFPYVTPSGVVGPCPDREVRAGVQTEPYWPETQLVDGGYVENTGLATVTDLADTWLPLVRAQNERALADPTRRTPAVVPLVVFLTNADREVTQPEVDAPPTSELTVPVLTLLRSGSALGNTGALLARARDSVELSGFCPDATRAAACDQLARGFPSRVVVVDRATTPEIGAPLGWVLSPASMTALDRAMAVQRGTTCASNAPWSPNPSVTSGPVCTPGYATLGDLARYYQAPPAAEQAPR